MNHFFKGLFLVFMVSLSLNASARRSNDEYRVSGNQVFYNNVTIPEADASSFQALGFGYAKDFNNVYLEGKILEYVNPSSFSLKNGSGSTDNVTTNISRVIDIIDRYACPPPADVETCRRCGEYHITTWDVFFDGVKVEDARASSFQNLGYGYGKDSFNVFFMGRKMPSGISTNSFVVLGNGYSKDNFDVYYGTVEVKGASASSFVVDRDGYAHDTFHHYYRGQRID